MLFGRVQSHVRNISFRAKVLRWDVQLFLGGGRMSLNICIIGTGWSILSEIQM